MSRKRKCFLCDTKIPRSEFLCVSCEAEIDELVASSDSWTEMDPKGCLIAHYKDEERLSQCPRKTVETVPPFEVPF